MKMKMLAVAAVLSLAAGSASALTLYNTDNPSGVTFTGFDWAQGGTAFTNGFTGTPGTSFTLTYFAWAVDVLNGLNPIPNPNQVNLDTIANGVSTGYQYTVVATVNEKIDSCTGLGATGSCTFSITGGSFNIYYSTTGTANASTGTGFTSGTSIISGDLYGPDTTFNTALAGTPPIPSGQAIATLFGDNLVTNTTYVKPALGGATSATTLQLGANQTNGYKAPTGFNGSALPGSPDVVFQADGNSSFAPVPEPGSLALLGLGLGVMGWSVRRSSKLS